MSVTTEITPIEGIDLDSTPPCTWRRPYPDPCGRPSAYRVTTTCRACSRTVTNFTCEQCHHTVLMGLGGCGMCFRNLPPERMTYC